MTAPTALKPSALDLLDPWPAGTRSTGLVDRDPIHVVCCHDDLCRIAHALGVQPGVLLDEVTP